MMRGTVADAQRISLEKRAAIEAAKQEKINQERNNLINEINSLKLLLSQKNLDIDKKSELINNLQKNVIGLKDNTISKLNQKIVEQNNIIVNKNNQINNLNIQVTSINSTIADKTNEIKNLSSDLTVKNNEIIAFKNTLIDKDRKISNLSSDNDKLTNAIKQKDNLIFELTSKLEVITNNISSYENQLLNQLEDEFIKIDINDQEELTLLGDS